MKSHKKIQEKAVQSKSKTLLAKRPIRGLSASHIAAEAAFKKAEQK